MEGEITLLPPFLLHSPLTASSPLTLPLSLQSSSPGPSPAVNVCCGRQQREDSVCSLQRTPELEGITGIISSNHPFMYKETRQERSIPICQAMGLSQMTYFHESWSIPWNPFVWKLGSCQLHYP